MATDLTTQNVPFTTPIGTTPFTVNVTNANLLSDLSVKDFVILVNGVVNANSNWAKTSQTILTYNGVAFGSAFSSEVRRVTPPARFQEITYGSKFSSALWEEEMNRVTRRAYEYTLNGIGAGSIVSTALPVDAAYNQSVWAADHTQPPTRSAVSGELELKAPKASPVLTGTPVAPTAADGTNTAQIATTAHVVTRVANALSGSPQLGGNPTLASVPTRTDNDTSIPGTSNIFNGFNLPPGTIADYAGTSAPSGWLECDGSNVSRTTYADLFAAIGTTWGAGDGSTTFGLPDLRDRVTISKSPGSLTGNRPTARSVAGTGGEETHTLTTPEMPSHTHTPTANSLIRSSAGGGSSALAAGSDTWTTVTLNNTGGGGAHENMMPFAVVLKIIRT